MSLDQASLTKLDTVHPNLASVVLKCAEICPVAFKVVEGVRSDEQAYINFGKGRTAEECTAAGCDKKYAQPHVARVTWLKNPLNTKHRAAADGKSRAVDLLPAPYDWKATGPFDTVAHHMFRAASLLDIHIRWGADWDEDGLPREKGETDSPHFELV